jgi:hypothetical protein
MSIDFSTFGTTFIDTYIAMHYHVKKGVVSFYISLMHVFVQKMMLIFM